MQLRKPLIGYYVISALFMGAGFYAYQIPEQQAERESWVTHTHEVLNQLSVLSSHLISAEAGERGYILTGDEAYLKPYTDALPLAEPDLNHLQYLTWDNPRQQARMPLLRQQISDRLAILKKGIIARKISPDAALKTIINGNGRVLMDSIHKQIELMENEENNLLRTRVEHWKEATSLSRGIFLIGDLILFLLISLVYSILQKEVKYRKQLLQGEQLIASIEREESKRLREIVSIQRDVVSHGLNLDIAMQTIAERTQTITHSDGAIVEILDGDEMVYRAASGNAIPHIGLRLKVATSLSGQCIRENAVLKCDDSEADNRVDRNACRKVGLRSMVVVPLQHHGIAIGVLKVLASKVNAFGDKDVASLELMAGFLSAALSDARAADSIRAMNDSLAEANSKLISKKSALEAANMLLESLATTDGLTGLKNHRAFQEHLTNEYQRSIRYKKSLSLILLDVDSFKSFNDAFGHPAGDAVLQKVASILQSVARNTDYLARHGGEEFALLLPETDVKGAAIIAERVRHAICQAPWDKRKITVSVGVSSTADSKNAATLLEDADKALYQSKNNGRNLVTSSPIATTA